MAIRLHVNQCDISGLFHCLIGVVNGTCNWWLECTKMTLFLTKTHTLSANCWLLMSVYLKTLDAYIINKHVYNTTLIDVYRLNLVSRTSSSSISSTLWWRATAEALYNFLSYLTFQQRWIWSVKHYVSLSHPLQYDVLSTLMFSFLNDSYRWGVWEEQLQGVGKHFGS